MSGFLLGIPLLTGIAYCVCLLITGVHSLKVFPGVFVFVCVCVCGTDSPRAPGALFFV